MNYYNENDPKAAAWLRELMKSGAIPHGYVDERSIADVDARDLESYTQCHFFAGIGGWSYALRLANWPEDEPVWTGSCPCQPFSQAGKGKGTKDPRHLWPEFLRLIAQRNPSTVFGEQVASKSGRGWLAGVRLDLEKLGYAVGAADLCAAGAGAPHIRQRLFWVADSNGRDSCNGGVQCGRKHGQFQEDGGPGRMEDSESHGRRNGPMLHQKREEGYAQPGDRGSICGVADTKCEPGRPKHEQKQGQWNHAGPHNPADCGSFGGVGDSQSWDKRGARLPPEGFRRESAIGGSGTGRDLPGFWDRFDILPCIDGKARRVEPGAFPLAYGIPGRVGLIRGYGNAIVPEIAAMFIRAAKPSNPCESVYIRGLNSYDPA